MTRVLGIDLGTTNSCVAVVQSGTPFVVPVGSGGYVMPSVVGFHDGGAHVVGEQAKRELAVRAAHTVVAAKRLIGRGFQEAHTQRAFRLFAYRCVEGPSGDVRIQIDERTLAIQEVSALVLAELKRAAEQHFGEAIDKAVVTVPAHFNDLQRQATRDAARIAGLDVLRIINEPTAAALAYGFLDGTERRIAVYDMGGGTFDVSVLRIGGGIIEVLATSGDAFLGGQDFDTRMFEWLQARIEQDHSLSLASDPNARQRVREACEAAKISLSDVQRTNVTLPFLAKGRDGEPVHAVYELTRETFEKLVSDYVERARDMFVETLAKAGLKREDLTDVLLVGGMTRMPLIRASVGAAYGGQPSYGVHPDLVVAVGAAIQGALLVGDAPDAIFLDVTPHNLGIMTVAKFAETLIPKDTTVPTEVRRMFTTAKDNQTAVTIIICQGSSRRIENNEILGQFTLDGIRPAERGAVQIEVCFGITADGIVNVSARDIDTGQEQAIRITGSRSLDPEELKQMIDQHQDQLLAAIDGAASSAQPGSGA